jgi:chromosome segregation ATPase
VQKQRQIKKKQAEVDKAARVAERLDELNQAQFDAQEALTKAKAEVNSGLKRLDECNAKEKAMFEASTPEQRGEGSDYVGLINALFGSRKPPATWKTASPTSCNLDSTMPRPPTKSIRSDGSNSRLLSVAVVLNPLLCKGLKS